MSRSECNNCQGELSLVFIKCAECSNTSICLSCFSRGAEFREHQKNHSYKIIDKGAFSITDQSWSAQDERNLLEGIEQFGIGNWEDVAIQIGGKTSKEVEEHYYTSYIESTDLGRVTVPQEIPNRMTDHTPPLHESILSVQLPQIDVSKKQELDQLAYMPLRDDYEMEHDNESEVLISGLTVNGDEEDLDTDLKVVQVQMYLDKLRERHRRKSIVREYHLVEKFFGKTSIILKQDRDYLKRLRSCLQYMREEQALTIAKDSRREQNLKAKIKHLKLYRKNGIKKLEDGIVFDVKQRRRNKLKLNSESTRGNSENNQSDKSMDRISLEYGHQLLSADEKVLCKNLKMIPSIYLTTKTLIIKDSLQKQRGVGIKIRFPSYVEKFQRKKIQNFLSNNGWLPRVSS